MYEDRNLTFDAVHRKYHDRIYLLILQEIKDRDAAEELTVETFQNASRAWTRYRSDAPVETWLTQIALNNCKNYRKTHQREREATFQEDPVETDSGKLSQEIPDLRMVPEQMLLSKEFADLVQRAVEALPMEYQMVLLLEQEDHSYEEIARITKLSVPAVKTRLHRARNRVRQWLYLHFQGWTGQFGEGV
jgi:RNA polymerase sigma-70 factor (ECF subfamily)